MNDIFYGGTHEVGLGVRDINFSFGAVAQNMSTGALGVAGKEFSCRNSNRLFPKRTTVRRATGRTLQFLGAVADRGQEHQCF